MKYKQRYFILKKDLPMLPKGWVFKTSFDGTIMFSILTDDEALSGLYMSYKFKMNDYEKITHWFDEVTPSNPEMFTSGEIKNIIDIINKHPSSIPIASKLPIPSIQEFAFLYPHTQKSSDVVFESSEEHKRIMDEVIKKRKDKDD